MYSEEYEKRWAELQALGWYDLTLMALRADGHTSAEIIHYSGWSRIDLEKTILRSEFPAEASNG